MKIKKPEKGQRNLRKGRRSVRGFYYFITICCKNKKEIFKSKENADIFFKSLEYLEKNGYIEVLFAILMPDHAHLIFKLTGDRKLSEVIKSLKQFTGRKIKEKMKTEENIWQKGFYDHAIRKDENLTEIMRYCLFNPVRKGIIQDPRKYPFWKSKYKIEEII